MYGDPSPPLPPHRWTLVYSPTPGAFLYVTTDSSDPRTSPTAIFRQDWGVAVGPRIMLRINTPGLTTVKAVASRGDLPDSPVTTCRYNVSSAPPAAQCVVAATSMDAPAWVRRAVGGEAASEPGHSCSSCALLSPMPPPPAQDLWGSYPDYSDVATDDRTRADPLRVSYEKDWGGWTPYQGIVCGA